VNTPTVPPNPQDEVDDIWGVHLESGTAALVVAHPDDETLWAGGTLLLHPKMTWRVFALCRAGDLDRAPKFRRALEELGASGDIADLDDGPEQAPLAPADVEETICRFLGADEFDLLLTHGPKGEYTRHRRHEETSRAVAALWQAGRIRTRELWMFAYEDGGGARLPEAIREAHRKLPLRSATWQAKRRIITEVYGFAPESWEARTTPRWEAFWCFTKPGQYARWQEKEKTRR